jgi:hypothetical protein
MLYIKIENNQVSTYPYSINDLRRDKPNVSFPKVIPTETLNEYGVFLVTEVEVEEDYTKVISELNPILVDGVWTQNYLIVDASQEELDERFEIKWEEIRQERNKLLTESDWTQLGDSPLSSSQEWKDYRQSLRDITNQTNPFQITWPTKP